MTIDKLTTEQYEEYKPIALLLNQGKFVEFQTQINIFKKKHNIK